MIIPTIRNNQQPENGTIMLKSHDSEIWEGRIRQDVVVESSSFEEARKWFDNRSLPWIKMRWTDEERITVERYSPNWSEVYGKRRLMKARDRAIVAINNISWLANRLESIREQISMTAAALNLGKVANEHDKMLEDLATRLNKIQQDLGNYMNACDAVDENDEAITSPGFEAFEYLS